MFYNEYFDFYQKLKPINWYSFSKSEEKIKNNFLPIFKIINKNYLDTNLMLKPFKNEFTIVVVADKHDDYKQNQQVIFFGTTDRKNVFGWFNEFRDFVCIDFVNINGIKVLSYSGTDIIFLRLKNSELYYNSEIFIKRKTITTEFIFKFEPHFIKIYEIIVFDKYLENNVCLEIEYFMKERYLNILYKVKL